MLDLLYSYKTTVKFLGSVLGPDYEVVLQDLSNKNHSVIAIENGHISGRTIGSPLTSAVFQMLSSKVYEENDFIANYKGVAENGHILRSSSMFIKDSNGNPIGLLCINFDDSRYMELHEKLFSMIHPGNFVKNIAFGLKNIKTPQEEINKKVDWAIDVLGLEEYRKRKPKNLSGGQRQRVALGRAIVRNQKVFLMDEPLSNLDAKLRVSMRNEITKLHRELGATTIYVTHDQVEAMTMADRIVVMKDGVIQQIGSPIKLYDEPVNKFVAGFIGSPQMNFIEVNVKDDVVEFNDGNKIHITKGIRDRLQKSGKMILGIRGEDIKFDSLNMELRKDDILKATVSNVEVMGNENNIYFTLGGETIIARASKYDLKSIGEEIEFVIDSNRLHFFDIETEESILNYLNESETAI